MAKKISAKKILIVEDEEASVHILKKIMSEYGKCETARTAEEALTFYETAIKNESKFDLILLDISLEEGNGIAVLKKIRKLEKEAGIKSKHKGVTVIMTTGNQNEKVVKKAIAAGCNGYILKPLEKDMIELVLKQNKFIS